MSKRSISDPLINIFHFGIEKDCEIVPWVPEPKTKERTFDGVKLDALCEQRHSL